MVKCYGTSVEVSHGDYFNLTYKVKDGETLDDIVSIVMTISDGTTKFSKEAVISDSTTFTFTFSSEECSAFTLDKYEYDLYYTKDGTNIQTPFKKAYITFVEVVH